MAQRSTATTPPSEDTAPLPRETDERQRREERILDAAATLLVRWGYRKTTLDDVAREAGVGKGTVYLHWKDKHELFRAAIARAHHQASDDIMARIAADPEGGRPHRVWTHSMLAACDHPLVAAMFKGQPDIFQGLVDSLDQQARTQLVDNAATYVVQNQQAGLIRADLPPAVIAYLMAVLKLGIIHAPAILGQSNIPSMEDMTGALSDLIRRWLEPDAVPADTGEGRASLAELLDKALAIEQQPTA